MNTIPLALFQIFLFFNKLINTESMRPDSLEHIAI